VLTRLTFFDLQGARDALQRSPARGLFERSRVMYAHGVLADLEWRIDDAIYWFEKAVEIHPDDPGAHHHLARLYFLKADAAGSNEHLRSMNRLSLSALTLRGESINVSQNLIGQLVNELRLDDEVRTRLAALQRTESYPQIAAIAAVAEIVQSAPGLTAPAIFYMLALRQSGNFALESSSASDLNVKTARQIPRKIMQFWDQKTPPEDITQLLRTWVEAHPGYAYCRFDNAAAREYLAARYPPEVLQAFRRARHPAQASDLFRLAYLWAEGGFYVDADDRCVGDLTTVVVPGVVLVGYQEQYGTLGNNFLGCVPGEPVIERALGLAVESLNRGDGDSIWLATGPGLLTRAFTEILSRQGAEWHSWLRQRRVLDRNELSTVSWPHSISQYKNTRRGWLLSGFKSRIDR
jgi:mannosyltransferase OCH1-like enzyme